MTLISPRLFWTRGPEQLDLSVWPIFVKMSQRGIRVDTTLMETLRIDVVDELETQQAALDAYAGRHLNPHSSDDVGAWLWEEGLAGKRRTRGGAVATDERTLSHLIDLHPVPGAVLECRGLRKLLSTFIEPVLAKVTTPGGDGAIHPRWRLTKVKSGRPAMEDPNLLAFPSRDEWGKRVRECFVARPGHVLISGDFSQIEPRVAAALSGDPALCAVFTQRADLYADMARRIFRVNESDESLKLEPLKTTMRQPAKIILLGCVLYGMGPDRLYDELIKFGCGTPSAPYYDMAACEEFVRRRFEPYPRLGILFRETVAEARRSDGWVATYGGRRRFLPALLVDGMKWPAAKLREEAERQAFNHLIQGSAQDIMKHTMLRVEKRCPELHPLLQIYDEMIYEAAEDLDVTAARAKLVTAMESTFHGAASVQIEATVSMSYDWAGLK